MADLDDLRDELQQLRADNRRLRRLLDREAMPSELRHRLRSTMGLMRHVVRRTGRGSEEIETYSAHLLDRIDSMAQAQSISDELGSIDLHALVAERLLKYRTPEGDKLSLSGPAVRLRPRFGQHFSLAVHELAVNAVEHGALAEGGTIAVNWRVSTVPPRLTFTWSETALPSSPDGEPGFGHEVLSSMLNYEFCATTTIEIREGRRVSRIDIPWSDDIGEMVPELTIID